MQQIERYGVIALLFMLVTILAVSFWDAGESDAGETEAVANTSPLPAEAGRESFSDPLRLQALRPTRAAQREQKKIPLSERELLRFDDGSVSVPPVRTVQAQGQSTNKPANAPAGPGLDLSDRSGALVAGGGAPERRRSDPGRRRPSAQQAKPPSPLPSSSIQPAASTAPRETQASAASEQWTYEVKSGDTLEKIAARLLGDGTRWREIQAQNGDLDPRRLHVGKRLILPSKNRPTPSMRPASFTVPAARESAPTQVASAVPAVAPPAGPTRTYVIKKGDILGTIAQRELGTAKAWKQIVALNPGIDPGRLLVGSRLKLPGAEAPTSASRARRDPVLAQAETTAKDSRFRVR